MYGIISKEADLKDEHAQEQFVDGDVDNCELYWKTCLQ